ncbi:MAG: DUF2779 domain-containing protein [Gammaproteobacteria bacterium]|nr:DUF2779 domain-containing protein [Gammaproteobacteria bacterium]
MALAESGFQVAELARRYYPDGILVESLDNDEAIKLTADLLQRGNVIIFEAAVRYQNLFLRADILIKKGNHLQLIEVKSKSIDGSDKSPFMTKNKGVQSDWKEYIIDVAFQKYVLFNAFPDCEISSYLMLVDKSIECQTEGLNQRFRISKNENGKVKIIVSQEMTKEELSEKILRAFNIDHEINYIFKNEKYDEVRSFTQQISFLAQHYADDIKIYPKLGSVCASCEFKASQEDELSGLKSGFKECWSQVCSFTENDFLKPTILDIWDYRKKDKLIESRKFKMSQVEEEDIEPKSDSKPGFSRTERQWLQVKKVKYDDNEVEIDKEGLETEIKKWIYPLHFIDFETTMVAIPFNKGDRPYQGIAFQFSHHILREDGAVEHASQFINKEIGKNPNLDFIRALKVSLENDNGTIFRFADHENTFLNMILNQIQQSNIFIEDKEQLIDFIKLISKSTGDSKEKWKGNRCMVDLLQLVKRFYYDPLTNGSNSIKKVFPAILSRSLFLKNKYSAPIYGSIKGIRSLNFKDWQWIKTENGKNVDPYDLLPNLFQGIDVSDDQIDFMFNDESLKAGGAASIAYSRMQFSEMNELEREELTQALLRYCELDTLAMVMIVEEWIDMLGK